MCIRDRDPTFLTDVGAAVSLTSVGADNPYGHPSAETLGRLSIAGARSYRTDLDGAVAVSGGPTGLRVVAQHGVGAAPAGAAMRRGWSRRRAGNVVDRCQRRPLGTRRAGTFARRRVGSEVTAARAHGTMRVMPPKPTTSPERPPALTLVVGCL